MEKEAIKILRDLKLFQMAQIKIQKELLEEIKSMNRKMGELI